MIQAILLIDIKCLGENDEDGDRTLEPLTIERTHDFEVGRKSVSLKKRNRVVIHGKDYVRKDIKDKYVRLLALFWRQFPTFLFHSPETNRIYFRF